MGLKAVSEVIQLEHQRLRHHQRGYRDVGTLSWRACRLDSCVALRIALDSREAQPTVLDRETCDWVIDTERDTAICRTHGEVVDGVDSKHFPGNSGV